MTLFALTLIALALCYILARTIVTSKAGKVLVAIRDAESRTRFLGFRLSVTSCSSSRSRR